MNDFAWSVFNKTGSVEAYLLSNEYENINLKDMKCEPEQTTNYLETKEDENCECI